MEEKKQPTANPTVNGHCKHGLMSQCCHYCLGGETTHRVPSGPPGWFIDLNRIGAIDPLWWAKRYHR